MLPDVAHFLQVLSGGQREATAMGRGSGVVDARFAYVSDPRDLAEPEAPRSEAT